MRKPLGPKIRVPPLFYAAGFFIGLWLESVSRLRIASEPTPSWLAPAGWLIALAGFLFSFSGIATFGSAGTTMFPFDPASRLVETGPYRFTRNPMYVGNIVTYVGIALAMNVVWPLILLPLVIVNLYYFVIREEEKYLSERFGDAYVQYCRRVRRWV